MIACDTSVLVAAFARWHHQHDSAVAALARTDALVDHVAVEAFSVLTRLPPPKRVSPTLVTAFLAQHFTGSAPRLTTASSKDVLTVAEQSNVSGGAVYDLVVALTAVRAGASLISLDRRAAPTYEAVGVDYELIA